MANTRPAIATQASLYWQESARPLVSLAFVAPMIVIYEVGLLLLGPDALRNGADAWLRSTLHWAGFGQYFLLPLLTCAILLGCHHLRRDRWHLRWAVLYGMLLESMTLGFVLVVFSHCQGLVSGTAQIAQLCSIADVSAVRQVIGFFGAGIYEELLFRLMLLPAIVTLLCAAGTSRAVSWITAIVLSSLLFAAAHYRLDLLIGSYEITTTAGDVFQWNTFVFRSFAGAFFGVLYRYRGFGVAAGSHALYDILISVG